MSTESRTDARRADRVSPNAMKTIRQRILSGTLFIIPLAVTLFIAQFLYVMIHDIVGGPVKAALDVLFADAPTRWLAVVRLIIEVIATIIFTLALMYLIGLFSTIFLVKRFYSLGEALLLKIPILKTVYGTSKQVIDMTSSATGVSFRHVVRVAYPVPGSYTIGFVTNELTFEGDDRTFVSVLMPTVPVPTPCYLFIFPVEDVEIVEITVEEGMKLALSGGVVAPERLPLRPYRSGQPTTALNEPGEPV